jgi:peptidoglycan/LPS O-acetylase OafA/YrhL
LGLLRILLAACVFFGHSRPLGHLRWLSSNEAVELFFVVSGFYMQLILSTRYTKEKLGGTWACQFYKARYFRLLPTYLLGVLLVVGLAFHQPSVDPSSIWTYVRGLPDTLGNVLFKAFLCFTNMTILFQDVTMFLAAHHGQIQWSAHFQNSDVLLWKGLAVFQGWSLGIELSFYLLAPYLLNLPSRWLILGAICSLVAKAIALGAFNLGDPWTYRFFPFELGSFLLGALAFRYRSALGHLLPKRMERYCAYPLAIAIAAMRVPVPLAHVMYPLALACVLPYLFRMTSGRKADQLIGELSYPFYIFHVFALRLARSVYYHHWIPWSYDSVVWMGLGMTLVLSAIALVFEMRLIEPWRVRFAEPKHRPAMSTEVATSAPPSTRGQAPAELPGRWSTSLRLR